MDLNKQIVATYNKIAKLYTKQYFNDLSEVEFIDKFLDKLPYHAKVLDVGCGPGQFTQYMMRKGMHVTGIDYSSEMLKIAQQKVPIGIFKQADMRNLPFEAKQFDGLFVAYSLIHIPSIDIPHTLNGFHRVLKVGGYIEIIAQKGDADAMVNMPVLPSEKMFFNLFTKDRLATFLQEADFEIEYLFESPSLDPNSVSGGVIYTIAKKNSSLL